MLFHSNFGNIDIEDARYLLRLCLHSHSHGPSDTMNVWLLNLNLSLLDVDGMAQNSLHITSYEELHLQCF